MPYFKPEREIVPERKPGVTQNFVSGMSEANSRNVAVPMFWEFLRHSREKQEKNKTCPDIFVKHGAANGLAALDHDLSTTSS